MALVVEPITWTDESSDPQVRHLRLEISGAAAEAGQQASEARRWAAFWNGAYIMLGLPSAVLAAVSAATGLSSANARVPAALLALVSASLTAASGFLRSDARAIDSRRRSSAWRVLEADARRLAALEGYQGADRMGRGWESLLEQRKLILAGDYEAALGVSRGEAVRFAGAYVLENGSLRIRDDLDEDER
jgi:hypothetical protein